LGIIQIGYIQGVVYR